MTDKLECGQVKNLLALRVSQDLDVDEAAMVDRHSRYCEHCRKKLASFSNAIAALREAGSCSTPIDDGPSLWDQIEPRLGPAGRQRRIAFAWISTRQLAVACAALIALTVYLEGWTRGPRMLPVADPVRPPVQEANQFANQVPDAVIRPMLGVAVQQVDQAIAKRLGLNTQEGAIIAHVLPASAADLAGLQTADVILAVDDVPIRSPQHLAIVIGSHRVGTALRMQIYRDGRIIQRRVVLGAQHSKIDEQRPSPNAPVIDSDEWNHAVPHFAQYTVSLRSNS